MKQVVLITGAAGGIGRAAMDCFSKAGWQAAGIDRRSASGFAPGGAFRKADVAVPGDIEVTIEWIGKEFGRLDAIINNAAVQICKPLIEMQAEEWDLTMETNLRPAFLLAHWGYSFLAQSKGSMVHVSSVHALATSINIAAYAASKGALVALTRAMALEFGPAGIRVNALLPGAVSTQMLLDGVSRSHLAGESIEAKLRELGGRTALGRVGNPEEIAKAILFLADSKQSGFMTGQTMIVDGGATARLSTE
jgi:glucose 1-dehydrogenase